MPAELDDAVCIRQWDWSETSQTVSLICERHGLIRGLAKGSKRPKAPYSGGIELLTRGTAGIILKKSSDLALITEWDLTEVFGSLRTSLRAHHVGLYMADVMHHTITVSDPHPALFRALLASLRAMTDAGRCEEALLAFQWATLAETGYTPRLDATQPDQTYRFAPAQGGLVDGVADEGAWRVRTETVELLRTLETGAEAIGAGAPAGSVSRANRLLASYLRTIIGREPRTMPVVFGEDLPR